MATDSNSTELKQSLLGKTTDYSSQYDPAILYPVPRKLNRDDLGLTDPNKLPFYGQDIWHGYELSWLNSKGKPVVALARFEFDYDSENIVESKSFKLYLNSFNQSRFESPQQVQKLLQQDLSNCAKTSVTVTLYTPQQLTEFTPTALPGDCIDELDIEIDNYQFAPQLLKSVANPKTIKQTLHSHLLKSNCLITNQPDWASVVIDYHGPELNQEALLGYLISFRQHNEFHEQCVERIFNDIWCKLKPQALTVVAYYTRRGGLDINPIRSSSPSKIQLARINRQ